MAQVAADDVRKSYGETVALDGVTVEVGEGEVFALVGPNGAGKTTLVRCLTGSVKPDSGEPRLLGAPPTEADVSRLGVLPQEFHPPERLTVDEVVGYYASLYPDEVTRDVDTLIDEMGLEGSRSTRYADLSGGQRSRVRVASALVNDPDVLFLDEPTTGIDPEGREDVWNVVEELARSGTTVFLTTHYMREVERLADRVALLSDGRIVETGATDEVVREFAGAPRLVVRTTTDADTTDLPYDVTRDDEDGTLTLHGVEVDGISDALDALQDAGVEYDEIRWKEPDLEDAYLALT